ncbi:MAG TPA: FAD-dependent oxidoreductase [Methanoregulaceae archaeon]|nr:FAD-dependent oxidoreductase [Methanoregulaceae archaeon]HPS23725.1 FAD-dependent oxidoreductase [Methanoregulaceae archaeon]
MKTAILGGGLSGLTLARFLHERGEDLVVLEAEPAFGGLCRSRREGGFCFDSGGSHIIFSRDEEVLGFMLSVLGENRAVRKRNTRIFYKDRFVKYPFENGLSELPKEDLYFCLHEYIKTLIASEKGELSPVKTFQDWIYATFGKGIAECYLLPYNRKIWNYPPEQMSAHWVEGRVPRPPVEDIIRSAVGIETEGYTHQAVFSYPQEGGIEALVRAVALPITDRMTCGFRVSSIRRCGEGWEISDGIRTISADRLISTIPLQHLIPALEGVPEQVREAVGSLRYNSVCSVFIGVNGKVPDISWLYVPDPGIGLLNRVSFPSNYSSWVAPEGCGSVLAEITYNEGDPLTRMDDTEIIRHVIQSLETMQLVKNEDVIYTGIARHRFAYVVYDLDYLANIHIVREYCREIGIDLVGRFAQFEYLNMDGCIRSVMEYVGKIA